MKTTMAAVSRSASTPRERMSASVTSAIGWLKMAAAAGKVWLMTRMKTGRIEVVAVALVKKTTRFKCYSHSRYSQ